MHCNSGVLIPTGVVLTAEVTLKLHQSIGNINLMVHAFLGKSGDAPPASPRVGPGCVCPRIDH